jgi:hypothetical protein
MRNNLLGEIRTAINSKAKSVGCALVLDTSAESAQRAPVILYNSGDNDITEAVIQQLNVTAPADAVKPADAKPAETKPAEKKATEKK